MEKLKQSFANAAYTLNLVAQKLSNGQLLTDQDCLEVVRQINESSQEQTRLVKELEGAGIVLADCTNIHALEETLVECRRQKEEQDILAQLHAVVTEFSSVRAVLDVHKSELDRVQSDLVACDDKELLQMETTGQMELYRKFIGFVRASQVNMEDVGQLTNQFGYQLPFAILRNELTLDCAVSTPQEIPTAAPTPEPEDESPASGGMLRSMYPIKRREANVDGFRNALKRFPVEASILLPALSQMGILNVELTMRLSELLGWNAARADADFYAEQIKNTFRALAEKGFIAAYPTQEYGDLYCLTEYGYNCLHKQTILKEAKNLFAVPIDKRKPKSFCIAVGSHKILGQQQMDTDILLKAFAQNQQVEHYLSYVHSQKDTLMLSDEDLETIMSSLVWKNDGYIVKVPIDGACVPCQICFDSGHYDGGAILFLTSVRPEGSWEDGPIVFCDGKALSRWKDGWNSVIEVRGRRASDIPADISDEKMKPSTAKFSAKTETPPTETPPLVTDVLGGDKQELPEEPEAIDIILCDAQENAKRLLQQKAPIRPEDLLKLTVRLIAEDRITEASVLAETLAKAPGAARSVEAFYQALRQSIQVPGNIYHYSSEVINEQQSVLPDDDPDLRTLQQTMILSTLLWAMAFPSVAYDHSLYNNAQMTVSTTNDQIIQSLVTLLSEDLKDISFQNDGLGFSPAIISGLVDNSERERQIAALCSQASALKRTPTSTINITGLETCLKQMVGPTSEIGCALLHIEQNRTEEAEDIRTRLEEELGSDFLKSDGALENYIDQCWNSLRRSDSHLKVKRLDNDTPARRVCKKALTDRVALIKNWLDLVQSTQGEDFQQFRNGYARILNKLKALLAQLWETALPSERPYEAAGQNILRRTAWKMLSVLNGALSTEDDRFYYPLLLTPELMLEENGGCLIVSELYGIPSLEPWSFVLRAVVAKQDEPESILTQIDDYKAERWYRNYGIEALLCACTGRTCPDRTLGIQSAQLDAEQSVQSFKSNARLNRAYGKIQEYDMETAFFALDLAKKLYFHSHNYASFKGFLHQLNNVLDREIEVRAAHYEKQVQELEETFAGTEMLDAIRQALETRNFNSVDSYINQLQSGVTELLESDRSMEQKTDFLAQFQDCEEGYFNECQDQRHRSENPARWGERALEAMPPQYRHWTSPNEKKKGCSWLGAWIMRKNDTNTSAKVQSFLTGLGFRVKEAPVRDNSFSRTAMYEVYRVSAEKTSPRLKDYAHPIYKFGTDLSDPMYVVCLYGCKGASTLINVMTGDLQLSGSTIVLMDGSLTVADRHLVAAKFKADTSGQSPFLIIDRVLLLYLASLDEGDRQKAMLHCTLPYTFEVLYGSGSGAVPEEMFIGRVSEMNDLRSEQGPCLVYGGRQLGKTALLNRASKTIHNPQNLEYSFCVDVKDEGSAALLEKVNRHLEKLHLLDGPCSSLKVLCETLQSAYEDGKLRRLQIFVDEVDELFAEFAHNDFKALRPFIVLRDTTSHHVKFVFAGTHNVAATDKADMENNNLVHMGKPLCIEPLSTSDAIRLIRIPMSYLGFEIGDEQIELILSNTNSYPGLIHMFCNALVQSVCRDYEIYYSSRQAKENPPYHISDEQMRAVFKEKDIRKEIGTRVMATIKLNRKYRVISCLLAHMVYEDRESEHNRLYGYGVRELLDYNRKELQIPALNEMPEKDLETLLDEMVHMGILWKNPQTQQFRFRQQDFLHYIGTSDQIIEFLLDENEEDGR